MPRCSLNLCQRSLCCAGQDDILRRQPGDILVSVADNRVITQEDLSAALSGREVGDTVRVIIFRSGRQYSADLTLHEAKGT